MISFQRTLAQIMTLTRKPHTRIVCQTKQPEKFKIHTRLSRRVAEAFVSTTSGAKAPRSSRLSRATGSSCRGHSEVTVEVVEISEDGKQAKEGGGTLVLT